ncbi:hypothetical protein PG996_010604 [Apiospora saccharicola]|uniref:Uncharacterized protein n=1 Tax=Apiospora saccharicola TaxID=335842 RepID=A0ABR1UP37_9PEZI
MDTSDMLSAVVQATVLQVFGGLAAYFLSAGAYDGLWADPVFRDWWSMLGNQTSPVLDGQNATAAAAAATSTSANNNTVMALLNMTSTNYSSDGRFSYPTLEPNPESLPEWQLPKKILAVMLTSALIYLWAVEVVVERWIAKGRVRRSSISWYNTMIKWLLEIVARAMLEGVVVDLSMALMNGKAWNTPEDFWGDIILSCVKSWIGFWGSGGPFVSLVSLIIIPAPNRLVFESAFYMALSIFVQWLLLRIISWAIKTDAVQDFFLKQLEAATDIELEGNYWAETGRLLDEL